MWHSHRCLHSLQSQPPSGDWCSGTNSILESTPKPRKLLPEKTTVTKDDDQTLEAGFLIQGSVVKFKPSSSRAKGISKSKMDGGGLERSMLHFLLNGIRVTPKKLRIIYDNLIMNETYHLRARGNSNRCSIALREDV